MVEPVTGGLTIGAVLVALAPVAKWIGSTITSQLSDLKNENEERHRDVTDRMDTMSDDIVDIKVNVAVVKAEVTNLKERHDRDALPRH